MDHSRVPRRGRGLGRPPALPRRSADLGHGRGRRSRGHQRAQDGISARLTHADDDQTERRLVEARRALVDGAGSIERPPAVALPPGGGLELESVMTPRDAFFARTEQVPVREAAGRVVAEMVSPYPPGVPVLVPGERITREVLDYLTTGVAAGMLIPDAADDSMQSVRVVAE